ncbi:MAG: hypothetical protein ACLSUW_04920 [Akkermansia sp.]
MGCIFLFYNTTIAIAMTNIHPFTTAAACILTAGTALFTSSCQPTSPESYARQFATAQNVSVHGYNGRETLTSRVYADWGGMPDNARRAMTEYIKGAEWKKADYIRPQYFIQVDRSFWVICMDNDDARGHRPSVTARTPARFPTITSTCWSTPRTRLRPLRHPENWPMPTDCASAPTS